MTAGPGTLETGLIWLAFGALVATACRYAFDLLGRYATLGADRVHRRQLDRWWDLLQAETLASLADRWRLRTADWIRGDLLGTTSGVARFVTLSALINLGALLARQEVSHALTIGSREPRFFQFDSALEMIRSASATDLSTFVLIALFGAVLDVANAHVTARLVSRRGSPAGVRTAVLGVAFDLSAAAAFAALNFLVVTFVSWTLLKFSGDDMWLIETPLDALLLMLGAFSQLPLLAKCFWVAASAVPTTLYLLSGLVLFALRHTPQGLRRHVSNAIFLVSTESRPVMSQLGDVLGALGGLLVALTGFIRAFGH